MDYDPVEHQRARDLAEDSAAKAVQAGFPAGRSAHINLGEFGNLCIFIWFDREQGGDAHQMSFYDMEPGVFRYVGDSYSIEDSL